MGKKLRLEFAGFEEMAERLDKLGGDLKKTTEKALIETHKLLTPKVEEAFKRHDVKYSHDTMKSLKKDPKVEWSGSTAEIGVGFKISEGGFPSIFVMYGTKVYGTPRVAPDKKLYNSIYGNKKKIRELQEGIFAEEIAKL